MKIVIDIDEELYNRIRADSGVYVMDDILVENAIYEGTPLPKGHGDLIDRDYVIAGYDNAYDSGESLIEVIYNAPTIIEADKGEE